MVPKVYKWLCSAVVCIVLLLVYGDITQLCTSELSAIDKCLTYCNSCSNSQETTIVAERKNSQLLTRTIKHGRHATFFKYKVRTASPENVRYVNCDNNNLSNLFVSVCHTSLVSTLRPYYYLFLFRYTLF